MSAGYYVLGVVGGYILTSIFFLRCPVLHKKKRLTFKCRHISHRGGAAEKLENTMDAYRNAVSQGTEMLELDVQFTADKEVVVSHDNHLQRTTGHDIHIRDTTYGTLPVLKKEIPVTFHQSAVCFQEGEPLKIPRLEDVFQEFTDLPINIDIKVYDEELIEKVNELIKKYDREAITPCGNFSSKVTSRIYETNKNIPLIFPMTRVLLVLVTFYLGLLPFIPLKESCFEVPFGLSQAIRQHISSRKIRFLITIADFLVSSRILFKHLTDRGIHVYVWVLNDEKMFKKAFKYGVTGVMTDYPTNLRKFLVENPKYNH